MLGEGASGVIHQAAWRRAGSLLPVAVKLFRGAVTSDGLPHSEMAASISAGARPLFAEITQALTALQIADASA